MDPDKRDDRTRRQRIIDATLEVITEHGVRGLSHRRVAKVAEVPLSATTYHFGTMDALLEEAFIAAIERDRVALHARLAVVPAGSDPIPEIASMLHEAIADPKIGVLPNELLIAALRNERLRPHARAWGDSWQEALLPYVGDELRANLAVVVTGGILQRGFVADPPMTIEEIEALLRYGLALTERSVDTGLV